MAFLDVFKYFSPVIDDDGSPCRGENGQLLFTNKKDGSFVTFPEESIDITKFFEAVVSDDDRFRSAISNDRKPQDSSATIHELVEVKDTIWSNTRTREARKRDIEATGKLLEIAGSDNIQKKLKEKSSRKSEIWSVVGAAMGDAGFQMENAGKKCHQKWRNLQRDYRLYLKHKEETDNTSKQPPEFEEELERIFGARHYNNLLNVKSSTPIPPTSSQAEPSTSRTSTSVVQMDAAEELEPALEIGKAQDQVPICGTVCKTISSLEGILQTLRGSVKRREEMFVSMQRQDDKRANRLERILKEHHQETMERFDRLLDILSKK